jgi:spore coat protein CotH
MKSLLKFGFLVLLAVMSACEKLEEVITIETPDWTEATHGNTVMPDYSVVFPQDKVLRLDIEIDADDWTTLQNDLKSMPKGGPGTVLDGSYDPVWIPCQVYFNGIQWYYSGIRVKGNSSLRTTVEQGIKKYSFKLDFDQFEDIYPDINNQRFYGFKQLNLNNNFDDKSLMREKVAGDLFRDFGIPVARSAFYELYIDYGNGPVYFGLYAVVEEVDDTAIASQFTDATGNLYKPEGQGATFAQGSYDTGDLNIKNDAVDPDYSDVKELYDALHSGDRKTQPEVWRTGMEKVLDMDMFLKWLAANTVMQNWDTYGRMNHNYYLYHDPVADRFTWIPWDNNEALQDGKQGGAISINLSGVTVQWPLISFIASDEVYFAKYKQYAKDFANTVFEPARMTAKYEGFSSLIRDAASREVSGYTFLKNGISDFESAVLQLKQHVTNRFTLVQKL